MSQGTTTQANSPAPQSKVAALMWQYSRLFDPDHRCTILGAKLYLNACISLISGADVVYVNLGVSG